jgi:hypothetical protein
MAKCKKLLASLYEKCVLKLSKGHGAFEQLRALFPGAYQSFNSIILLNPLWKFHFDTASP